MSRDVVGGLSYTVYKGVAAEDIAKDSVMLYVNCPELTPGVAYGQINASITNTPITLTNRKGEKVSAGNVTTANHIVATWEGASNNRYPPLIRKGEPVELYRAEGQDKYYWRTTGSGENFRQTDRISFEVSAQDETKPAGPKDDSNSYSGRIDSSEQIIEIKTSKANGEKVAFSMAMNMKTGTFHLSDDSDEPGNRIFLDSGAVSGSPVFQVNLKSGITMKMEDDNLYFQVPGSILAGAKERIVFEAPIIVFNRSKAGVIIFNASSIAFNAAKNLVLNAANALGLNSLSTKIGGVLVAASMRVENAVKGAYGTGYTAPVVNDPVQGNANDTDNTPDTNVVGPPL